MTEQTTAPAAHPSEGRVPSWLEDAVFYQIFPERFANGDPSLDPPGVQSWGAAPSRENFFGGDLAGITAHLDHLVDLGVTALYLTPIFAAGTNHRYDAHDYFTVDPLLGDLEAFRTFVVQAHARGLRVVLDAVLNHCGDGHWAFRDVMERGAQSPYINWFYVEDLPVRQYPQPNYRTCSGCEYLPKWNAHNPEVRDHHLRVAQHWLAEGIDGWRLDVPYFVNTSFWRQFRRAVKDAAPEAYIVAEEWRSPTQWLAGDTADGTMNYTLRDLVLGFTADRTLDAAALADGFAALDRQVPLHARTAMLNLLGSHDTERLLSRHRDDAQSARLALALMITSPGAPMIYYGDEVGMTGDNDPGCRGCMPWAPDQWDHDTHAWVRGLLAVRAAHPALRTGTDVFVHAVGDVVVRVRDEGAERVVVAVNRGAAVARIPAGVLGDPAGGWHEAWPAPGDATTAADPVADGELTVQPRSVRILWRGQPA